MKKTKIAKSTWIGLLISFLSPLFIGLMACCRVITGGSARLKNGPIVYTGIRGNATNYFNMWNYSKFPNIVGVLGVFIMILGIIMLILEAILICMKKKYKLLINAIGHFLDIAFIPYLLLLLYTQYIAGVLKEGSMLAIFVGFFLTIIGYIVLTFSYGELLTINVTKEDKKEEPKDAAPSLTEDDVKSIVNACLAKLDLVDEVKSKAIADKEIDLHIQNLHSGKDEVKEETADVADDVPADEPVDAGEPAETAIPEDDHFANLKKRHRAKFETRIKGADQDLRNKYYELRDYIRSYDVKDRMSIPGMTFSLHRDRYVFITISGKKLKVYYALNPNDYADSTIPVTANTSKKFEDLPTEFKVKSDLSLKRAKILVDDVMKAKGISKPEEKK